MKSSGGSKALSGGQLPTAPADAASRGAREHYLQPGYYDRAYRERRHDVGFYAQLAARHGGPVLEYGVGSGRVALSIAAAGIDVVGVDHAKPMLDELQRQLAANPALQNRVRARLGDMRRVNLKRRFPLVIAPFNALLHLYTRQDVERFLARVRGHLEPRGVFVFDYAMPRVRDLDPDPERWYKGPKVRHPELGETVRYAERFHYAPVAQVLSTWIRFEGSDSEHSGEQLLTHRQFFPQELEALLHYNGFESRWSADFSGSRPNSLTDVLVVECRLRKGWSP
ncbi:MAG TPA: class I SAM-dependent methyltransferase [Polyangiaceae bacterium]|nr:class I SAM-dependent methyltransferase [Polyangiaceae bacterium]